MAYQEGQLVRNRYRIVRTLRQGGWATTYLAEDTRRSNKLMSIEIFPGRSQQDRQGTEPLLRRFTLLARLDHPNIVPILNFGVEAEDLYLVSRYMPDGTLGQRHPLGTIVPQAMAIAYVKQMASALQYLHDRRIIHSDVKPQNMFVDIRDYKVLLGGFGIAIFNRDEDHEHSVAGTPFYMAPEQIQEKPEPASDQYALGAVAYEWLSGHRVFTGDSSMDLMMQHSQKLPRPLRAGNPYVSRDIEDAVMKTLAKDPRARFASIQEFADSLERAADEGEPDLIVPRADIIRNDEQAPGLKTISAETNDTDETDDPSTSASQRVVDTTLDTDYPGSLFSSRSSFDGVKTFPPTGSENSADETPPPGYDLPQDSPIASTSRSRPSSATSARSRDIGTVSVSRRSNTSRSHSTSEVQARSRSREPVRIGSVPRRAGRHSSLRARLSSLFQGTVLMLNQLFSRGKERRETELSLFAIARSTLEEDNRAIVGKLYTVQAGVSQQKPTGFRGLLLHVPVQDPTTPLPFEIMLHSSKNIELKGAWHQLLQYDPGSAEPQLIDYPFLVKKPGQCYLVINFYRERQWLKSVRFEFEAAVQLPFSMAGKGG